MHRTVAWIAALGLAGLSPAANALVVSGCVSGPEVARLHPGVPFTSLLGATIDAGPDRAPLITFLGQQSDEPTYALWLHRCLDEVCSPGTTARLSQLPVTYSVFPRSVRRSDARPFVLNSSSVDVSLFDCDDAGCLSGANRELIRTSPLEIDVVVRSDGLPVIAYVSMLNQRIELILCADEDCSQFTVRPITGPFPGPFPPKIGLGLSSDDRPIVARTSFGDNDPFVDLILCESPACNAPVTRPIASMYGFNLELAMRSDDRAMLHFSDNGGVGKLALCSDAACSSAPTRDLAGSTSGVLMGAGNLPFLESVVPGIGFYACQTEDCATQGTRIDLAPAHSTVTMDSALGSEGRPHFTWIDGITRTVHTATCDQDAVRRNGFEPLIDLSAADAP
jgi:hypothetical protein